jgi:rhodanese-related sulfurtransferase
MFTRCSTAHLLTRLSVNASSEETEVPQIDVFELEEALAIEAENLVLIDIRDHQEYEAVRFSKAELIPVADFLKENGVAGIAQVRAILRERQCSIGTAMPPPQGDGSTRLIIYCTAGVGSVEVVERLRQSGMDAFNLKGGIRAWQQRIQPFHHQYLEIGNMRKNLMASTPIKGALTEPLLRRIAPKRKALWMSGMAILAIGFMGLETRQLVHNPDPLRPMLAAGVPLQWLEGVPFFGRAVRAAELPQMTVTDLKQKINHHDGDYVLVDVRSPEEYQAAKIPGAVSIPVDDIQAGKGVEKVKTLLHGRKLIVYCTSGYRSAKALMRLQEEGLSGIQIKGGISEWERAIGS